jgi:hypothetical protein
MKRILSIIASLALVIGLSPVYCGTAISAENNITVYFDSDYYVKGNVDTESETFSSDTMPTKTVTATAKAGFHFVNWTNNYNDDVITEVALTPELISSVIKVDGSYKGYVSFTANFLEDNYTVDFESANTDQGTVDVESDAFSSSNGAPTKTVTATAKTGYHFVNWTVSFPYYYTGNEIAISDATLTPEMIGSSIKDGKDVYHSATLTANFSQDDQVILTFKTAQDNTEVGYYTKSESIFGEEVTQTIGGIGAQQGYAYAVEATDETDDGLYSFAYWKNSAGEILSNYNYFNVLSENGKYISDTYTAVYESTITITEKSGFMKATITPSYDGVQTFRNISCTDTEISAGNGCSLEAEWQQQWYGSPTYTGNTGIAIKVNGKNYVTSYIYGFVLDTDAKNYGNIVYDSVVSESDSSVTVKYELHDYAFNKIGAKTGIYLTDTTYFIDAYTVGHKYELTNGNNTPLTNVKIFRIGDTYYNDNDDSFAISNNNGTIVIRDTIDADGVKVPNLTGGLAQYGTFESKASHYFEGVYDYPVYQLGDDDLGNDDLVDNINVDSNGAVSATGLDGGVSFQWNADSLAAGTSLLFTMYERYTTTGEGIKVVGSAPDTVNVLNYPKTVTKTFNVTSMLDADKSKDVTYTAASSLGYKITLSKANETFTGFDEHAITATVTYPKGINEGTDTITFTASYTDSEGKPATVTSTSLVTITLKDESAKTPQDAPKSGTITDGKGKINGTTDKMEYSLDGKTWKTCSNGSTTVAGGTYYVRYAETDTKVASEATKVVVTGVSSGKDYVVPNTCVK